MKNDSSPLYMIFNEQEETVNHFMSGCLELAKNEYLERHNKAAAYIHWKACRH